VPPHDSGLNFRFRYLSGSSRRSWLIKVVFGCGLQNQRRIPSFVRMVTGHDRRFWTPGEDALFGLYADEEVVRRTGRSLSAVQARRYKKRFPNLYPKRHPPKYRKIWSSEELSVLGTSTDQEVSRMLNRTREQVSAQRRAMGIPVRLHRRFWTIEEMELLGTASEPQTRARTRPYSLLRSEQEATTRDPALRMEGRVLERVRNRLVWQAHGF